MRGGLISTGVRIGGATSGTAEPRPFSRPTGSQPLRKRKKRIERRFMSNSGDRLVDVPLVMQAWLQGLHSTTKYTTLITNIHLFFFPTLLLLSINNYHYNPTTPQPITLHIINTTQLPIYINKTQ